MRHRHGGSIRHREYARAGFVVLEDLCNYLVSVVVQLHCHTVSLANETCEDE